MIAPLLCGMMLIVTLMRVAVPVGQRVTGDLLGTVPLGYRERLRLQRTNIYLLGVALLLGTLGGWMRAPINLIVVLAAFVIVSIPVQYTLTTEGIARNRVVFRRWEEFARYDERRGSVLLVGRDGAANFSLLLADAQHAAALRLLAQTPLGLPTPVRTPSASTASARGGGKGKRRGATTG